MKKRYIALTLGILMGFGTLAAGCSTSASTTGTSSVESTVEAAAENASS